MSHPHSVEPTAVTDVFSLIMNIRIVIPGLVSFLIIQVADAAADECVIGPGMPSAVRGMTLAPVEDSRMGPVGYGTRASSEVLAEIRNLGATWISLTPFGRMDSLDSTEILPDFEIPLEENIERTRATIREAKAMGFCVALIPHIWVLSGEWRGEIDMGSQKEWKKWFDSYERFIKPWARLSAAEGVSIFSIGVEFKSTSFYMADEWRRMIRHVRAVYDGLVTYSANWDEAADVGFWDAVDIIGINGFWPLARKPGDRTDVMRQRALEVAGELESLSIIHDKPVLLTETGCKAAADAALAPWEWPEHLVDLKYDGEYQAGFYQAVLEAMVGREWFAGLFIWKVISDPGDWSQDPEAGFSPRLKPGWGVLDSWFEMTWSEREWPFTSLP